MRRDHLGYYNALGLEPGAASLPAIKEAFRQAALMWHPDRQKVRLRSSVVVCINQILLFLKARIGFHEHSLVWYRSAPSQVGTDLYMHELTSHTLMCIVPWAQWYTQTCGVHGE